MKQSYRLALILLSLIILVVPLGFRYLQGNESLIGQESYFHLGIAQNINVPGSYPLANVIPNGFHYILSFGLLFFHPSLLGKGLPILLGVINVFLFYLVLLRFGVNKFTAGISGVILISSSLFIVQHSTLQPYSLLLTIGLLSAFIFSYSPKWSIPVILLSASIDIKGFFMICASMFVIALLHKKLRVVLIAFILGIVLLVAAWFGAGFIALNQFSNSNNISGFLASFGLGGGFSLFILLLSLLGTVTFWPKKNREMGAVIVALLILIASFFELVARVIILPFLVFFAAKGVLFIIERRWTISSLKVFTVFMVLISVLFSTVMTISGLVEAEPTLTKIEALNFLKTSPYSDVTLSSVENGIFIQRIAKRSAFTDSVTVSEKRLNISEQIFFSYHVKEAEPLLVQHNITHILIDTKMREGGVWTSQHQGLLFIVENSERFVSVFEKDGVQIYRFVD